MKIWLDDERPAPEGWFWVRSKAEFRDLIEYIGDHEFQEFSLDYYISYSRSVTGMTCLEMLIDELKRRKIPSRIVKMNFHSSDDAMNAKMAAVWSKYK